MKIYHSLAVNEQYMSKSFRNTLKMNYFLPKLETPVHLKIGHLFSQPENSGSVAKQNVKCDHRFIQRCLERLIPPLLQPVIANIAFQSLYHSFDRRSEFHHDLESFCHWRIIVINMRKRIERDRYRSTIFRKRTTNRLEFVISFI